MKFISYFVYNIFIFDTQLCRSKCEVLFFGTEYGTANKEKSCQEEFNDFPWAFDKVSLCSQFRAQFQREVCCNLFNIIMYQFVCEVFDVSVFFPDFFPGFGVAHLLLCSGVSDVEILHESFRA